MHVQRNGVQLMKAMAMVGIGEGEGEGGRRCLEDVAKQFKHWREARVRGERIPVALWSEAVGLCQEHAPQEVASVLRVAPAGLLRRLERGGDHAVHCPDLAHTEFAEVVMTGALPAMPEPAASRLELAPPPEPLTRATTPTPTPAHECVLELENARGAKMRVALNGAGLASLGALYSAFWSAA
jgi:hypothetical protein